ncbi:MAG: MBL fold metallo-hydrolase [Anaerolineae bacterium]
MEITFLGTSAANAYPEAFCLCSNCVRARALGGPSLRKRSAALIDDDLLIDLGPDVMSAAQVHGRPLTGVRHCLQTHVHADHLDPSHLLSRSPGYGTIGAPLLHFYASPATLGRVAELLARDCAPDSLLDPHVGERLNLTLQPVKALQSFMCGRYRVTAFPANHDPSVEPLVYAVQADGKCLLYATDTAALPEETWQGFHQHHLRFDVVILDHTYGPGQPGSDHLSAHQVIEHAARLRAEGRLAEGARVFGTHIAHEGNPPHPDLADWAQQHGYQIAFDGLTIVA